MGIFSKAKNLVKLLSLLGKVKDLLASAFYKRVVTSVLVAVVGIAMVFGYGTEVMEPLLYVAGLLGVAEAVGAGVEEHKKAKKESDE